MILTINGGSSSIKFSLFDESLREKLKGNIDRIGLEDPQLTYTYSSTGKKNKSAVKAVDVKEATASLINWLEEQKISGEVRAIGHRIVHGMERTRPAVIDADLIGALKAIIQYDPDHLPEEIQLIETLQAHFPGLPQIACFDTTFHAGLPRVAQLLPIPRRFDKMGIRRYGFHGLSYSYLMGRLAEIAGTNAAAGKVILAHLGSGASLAAVKEGKSIDTSMGFTPVGGIMMGSRPGDFDPGAAWFMIWKEQLSPAQFNDLINHQSGLLGVSETSSDVRDLLKAAETDNRAAEAIDLFCYQVRKCIGAFSAVLGGLDILVFSGGIGENSAVIRSRICEGLGYLGIEIEGSRNDNNELLISTHTARVTTYAIPTDEEWMIAKTVTGVLDLKK